MSEVFFFPSLYEGFGLPPLEAMAAGVAVLSSNTSAMPEVIGDAGVMVDPADTRACAEALCALLENRNLRTSFSAAGVARARSFTWERTGQETLRAYRLLAERVGE
jgi:glycosyltransferase involved in cell wall biosynthesis